MSQNPHVFDVTESNFQTDVVDASMQAPILLDFWAEWCGPCKTLGPILEQLAAQYNGAFRLGKVDVENAQQLAGLFGIQSIPTCVLIHNGQPVNAFQGAVPAAQLREFLTQNNIEPLTADEPAAELETHPALSPQETLDAVRADMAKDPGNEELKLDLAIALLGNGEADAARDVIAALPANLATDARAIRAQSHLDLLQRLPASWNLTDLRANAPEGDADAKFQHAVAEVLAGDAAIGLQALIDIMRHDRAYGEDLARRTLIDAFRILPDMDLVSTFRRKMSSLLF